MQTANKVDKSAYDIYYQNSLSQLIQAKDKAEYIEHYERMHHRPFFAGGQSKSYVRSLSTKALLDSVQALNLSPSDVTILDAGCGRGELSVYLGCKGFRVIGIDISETACACALELARHFEIESQCRFLAENLEHLPLEDNSIDFIIGHGALHHFIKYQGVPGEFSRIMKHHAAGYFADSFGENRLYHLFHDKEKMQRLGDVILTSKLIKAYFSEFEVRLLPTDWLVMLDKFYQKVLPKRFNHLIRSVSKVHFYMDRKIPVCPPTLYLSGSVMTAISKM